MRTSIRLRFGKIFKVLQSSLTVTSDSRCHCSRFLSLTIMRVSGLLSFATIASADEAEHGLECPSYPWPHQGILSSYETPETSIATVSPHSSASPSLLPSLSPSSSLDVSISFSSEDNGQKTEYKGPGSSFGSIYFRNLLQGKGILYVDQQLTAGEETETWVRAYASDISLFRRDFALAMMKLSTHQVLTAPIGQVRVNCRRVLSETES